MPVDLHDDAGAGFTNAAALAGLAAGVRNWLGLDDGNRGRSAARHFAVVISLVCQSATRAHAYIHYSVGVR